MCVGCIDANTWIFDSLLTYMEAAASLAAIHGKAIALPKITGCLVPEVEDNAVFVGSPACFVEDFAASGIRTRENQLRSPHRVRPFCFTKANRQARTDRRAQPGIDGCWVLEYRRRGMSIRDKRIAITEFHHPIELSINPLTLTCNSGDNPDAGKLARVDTTQHSSSGYGHGSFFCCCQTIRSRAVPAGSRSARSSFLFTI
jgi:hypothetical protein